MVRKRILFILVFCLFDNNNIFICFVADRLPSGKEVEILYIEEHHETVVTRGKHATQHPHDSVKVSNNVPTAKSKEATASKKAHRKRK